MRPSADELVALVRKYEEMRELRLLNERGELPDPKARMQALAARFPGALREIDELPMDEMVRRIDALSQAADGGTIERWMEAMVHFHGLMRGALALKRVLGDRDAVARTLADSAEARAWESTLGDLAEPAYGRITAVVFARIGALMECTAAEAKAFVFRG